VAEIHRKYKDRVYTTYLLRRSYRQHGQVKQQTLGNLSHLPPQTIRLVRESLKGVAFVPLEQRMEITRSRHHGHVAAVRAMLRQLKLHRLIDPEPSRWRDLVEAMIVARVVEPDTKLATCRWWHATTLPEDLGSTDATQDELYAAMDWLVARQDRIERRLARRHLSDEGLVLYDVTSTSYEGSHCPLARFGHSRDGKRGKRQIVFGLVTDGQGRPVALEVYAGNTADPHTVSDQVYKLKARFGLRRVVLAADRGMLTSVRLEELKKLEGLDWISALRAPAIRRLMDQEIIQPSLFDERDLMEVRSPEFPGERLVVCRNPCLAEERRRKREELVLATEKLLERLARRVAAGRLKRREKIGQALGRVINRYEVAKHFCCEINEGRFTWRRDEESIRREAALDGFYVLRTSVPSEAMPAVAVVAGYKSLSHVERAFRTYKSVDLRVRPIHHRLEDRVRAHIFLCMLAYYVEWHLREAWAPLLFDDELPGQHVDGSPVKPAVRSESALTKAQTRKQANGQPVHSFQTLLAELSTVVRNTAWIPACPEAGTFELLTAPTPLQREAFERVGLCSLEDRRQNRRASIA